MKNLSKYALVAALIISPLTAVQANQHMMKDGMAMHAIDDVKMKMMQKHMSEMEQLLESAKQEQDPKKRQKLLNDHAKSMGEMTEVMGGKMDGMGKICMPLRVAVTGGGQSPSVDAVMQLIGQERVIARIKMALAFIEEREANAQ